MAGPRWISLPLHFRCERCTQQLVAQPDDAGAFVRCPRCGDARRVPGPPADDWRPPAGVEVTPCPSCGSQIRVAARRCFHCGEILDPALLERDIDAVLAAIAEPSRGQADGPTWAERMALAALILALIPVGLTSMPALVLARKASRDPEMPPHGAKVATAATVIGAVHFTLFALIVLAIAAAP